MKIFVQIMDDSGKVLAEHNADASTPSQWRANPNTGRLISAMPAQSDQQNTGTYELFGITFQPHVRIDRPNGYTAPVPQVGNTDSMRPTPSPPWGTPSPTKATAPKDILKPNFTRGL